MSSFPLLLLQYFRLHGVSLNFRCNTNTQVWVLCSFWKLLLHDKIPLDCEWRIWFCMSEFELTPFPYWLLAVSLHCLNTASGACVQGSEPLVLAAQGQLGNTQPEFQELYSLPRPRGRARGEAVQCLQCRSSILDTLGCEGWFLLLPPTSGSLLS